MACSTLWWKVFSNMAAKWSALPEMASWRCFLWRMIRRRRLPCARLPPRRKCKRIFSRTQSGKPHMEIFNSRSKWVLLWAMWHGGYCVQPTSKAPPIIFAARRWMSLRKRNSKPSPARFSLRAPCLTWYPTRRLPSQPGLSTATAGFAMGNHHPARRTFRRSISKRRRYFSRRRSSRKMCVENSARWSISSCASRSWRARNSSNSSAMCLSSVKSLAGC